MMLRRICKIEFIPHMFGNDKGDHKELLKYFIDSKDYFVDLEFNEETHPLLNFMIYKKVKDGE